jgi:hypothetical protein
MIGKPYLENLKAEDVLDETASGNEHETFTRIDALEYPRPVQWQFWAS